MTLKPIITIPRDGTLVGIVAKTGYVAAFFYGEYAEGRDGWFTGARELYSEGLECDEDWVAWFALPDEVCALQEKLSGD